MAGVPAGAQYCNPADVGRADTTTTCPATTQTSVAPSSVVQSSTTNNGVGGIDTAQGGGTGTGTGTGTLPRTGTNAANLVRLAGVLLIVGAALTLAASKRRRHQAEI
jgi:LPXTG-motif cell wall-anchored protein